MTGIKFCGLTRAEDVELALDLGVSHIGLILADSPRRLDIDQATRLAAIARARIQAPQVVILLRNQAAAFIQAAVAAVQPDLLQFHGDEAEEQCQRHGLPYWKAIGCGSDDASGTGAGGSDSQALITGYDSAQALVLDGHAPGAAGGTGRRMDWSRWPRSRRRLVLAGGLVPDNVATAIALTRPFAVDVASGIEQAPGIKDHDRMRAFVAAVRSVAAETESRPGD